MKGSISAPFIKFPIATSLVMVGILFVGLIAYQSLPVAPLPKVDFTMIACLPSTKPGLPTATWTRPTVSPRSET